MKLSLIYTLCIAAASALPSPDNSAVDDAVVQLHGLSESMDPRGHMRLADNGLVQSLDETGAVLAEVQISHDAAEQLRNAAAAAKDTGLDARVASSSQFGRSATTAQTCPKFQRCAFNYNCVEIGCTECIFATSAGAICV